jgi:hypothetical protein
MSSLLHLLVFVISTAFLGWCVWLASTYRQCKQVTVFRVVLPYRIMVVCLTPFFIFASWHDWGKDVGLVFLAIAVSCLPLAAYYWTLTITLDGQAIILRHIFRQRRLLFGEITAAYQRDWSAEYVIRGSHGEKFIIPMILQRSEFVFETCRARMKTS